jgi:EvpB/VC_A0108, tail sheath N-terminal domain
MLGAASSATMNNESFVILILADLFGRAPKALPRLRDRRLITVTRDAFPRLLAHCRSTVAVTPEFPNSAEDQVNLRASWLGLQRLVDAVSGFSTTTVKIWDISREALLRDLYRAPQLDHSALFKTVVSDALGTFGSPPIGLIVWDAYVSGCAEDCELVDWLQKIAAIAGAPLLCGVSLEFFSYSCWDEVGNANAASALDESRLPKGWSALCSQADSKFLIPLLPRWRSAATCEDNRPYLHPGYLVAIHVANAMTAVTFAGAMGNLFHRFPGTSEDFRGGTFQASDSLWDVEVEWNCKESLASSLQNMGLNVVSESLIRRRDALERLVPAGKLARPKSHETLANTLLVGGTGQQLLLCVRRKRRSESGIAIIASITDWSRTQFPSDGSGTPILEVKHVAVYWGRLIVAVAWHPAAGGGIEQIKLQVPGIRDDRSEWFTADSSCP